MENNTFNVAVLGAGNIGSAVVARLMDLDKEIVGLNVKKVLVKDKTKKRDISSDILTDDFDDILNDDSIDLVIEVLGGVDPGKEYISALLKKGKAVITANKDIIADAGTDLIQTAKDNNACLYFEAAVAAGIPVLKPLIESLRGEELSKVLGIINGTSNYMLTAMEEGSTYEDALSTAQELGYAEPDPTNDVEGLDAKYKAVILSLLCFGVSPSSEELFTDGISGITKEDFEWAARLGKTIKLVAQIDNKNGFNARVHPVLIDTKHPLAAIRGSACHQLSSNQTNWYPLREYKGEMKSFEDVESSMFIRLSVNDEPGVLAKISGTFGENNVSIESVIQEGRGDKAELVLVTHEAPEKDIKNSIDQISALDSVTTVTSTLRVYV